MRERQVNNYAALFHQERRIYHLQGARVPLPNGVPLAPVGYAATAVVSIYVASQLPLLGPPLTALPFQVRWLLIPALVATVVWNAQPDGSGVGSWLRALAVAQSRGLGRRVVRPPRPGETQRRHLRAVAVAAGPRALTPDSRGLLINRADGRRVAEFPQPVEVVRRRAAPALVRPAAAGSEGRTSLPLISGERVRLVGGSR